MGLRDHADLLDGSGGGKVAAASVSCSICLEVVTDNGDRSWSKLQCGHQFHLDCIGSAFNIKGAMQCPNCRKIEKGQWLYANGSRPLPEFSMDDWAHDEDPYDSIFSEMSFGVQWCPFSGLTRLPTSFDGGEFSSGSYHDLLGHHTVFTEHTPVSTTTHACPYVAYFGPVHPSSSAPSGNMSDGSSFNNHWSVPSVPNEVPSSYAFPSMDVHYHNWDHSSPFATTNRIGGADQPSIPSMAQRTARNSSDISRPGMHAMLGHSAVSRAPTSITSSSVPPYPATIPRPRQRTSSLQAYYQSNNNPPPRAPVITAGRRSTVQNRGLAQNTPIGSSSDQSSGFYFFSSSSSGRTFQEPENAHRDQFHMWDRENGPSFQLNQIDRDSILGPFRQRHGSERMPSHNWS